MSARTFCKIGVAIGLANYAMYALASFLAGGDGFHGQIVNGHYFIAAGSGFVEVSRALFQFSRWEALALLGTFPLGLLCARLLSAAQRQDQGTLELESNAGWPAAAPGNGR